MKKLKYVKLFENFINESIEDDVDHIIEYDGYKYGKIYAGQNSNFQQNFTKPDTNSTSGQSLDLVGQSRIEVQYFVGSNDGKNLTCYNPGFSADKDGEFLGCFNRRFKTNYRTMQKKNKDGSLLGELFNIDE